MNYKIFLVILFFFQIIPNYTYSQENKLVGKIEGVIIDAETKAELIGANILILNSTIGAATDLDGKFVIENVPVGNYSIKISFLGYTPIIKTDIIVRSNRITSVNGELSPSSI